MSGDKTSSKAGDRCDSEAAARAALVPGLDTATERPPEQSDYSEHAAASLATLRGLAAGQLRAGRVTRLLLCGQHCAAHGDQTPHCWSSAEHRAAADQVVSRLQQEQGSSLAQLLAAEDCQLLQLVVAQLQPQLEQFPRHPAAVAALVWLLEQVPRPQLRGPVLARLLPHLLNITEHWMPHCKVAGCRLVRSVVTAAPAPELVFYGRAELLWEPLLRLLSHTEVEVVAAAAPPLLQLAAIRHAAAPGVPASPGPGDTLAAELLTRLELSSCGDTRQLHAGALLQLVERTLGRGVARWAARLCRVVAGLLELGPAPAAVFETVSAVTRLCPECVAGEVGVLLPSLVKFVYHHSWRDPGTCDDSVQRASVCIQEVTSCDPAAARALCHDLHTVTPVNNTFDTLVSQMLASIEATS